MFRGAKRASNNIAINLSPRVDAVPTGPPLAVTVTTLPMNNDASTSKVVLATEYQLPHQEGGVHKNTVKVWCHLTLTTKRMSGTAGPEETATATLTDIQYEFGQVEPGAVEPRVDRIAVGLAVQSSGWTVELGSPVGGVDATSVERTTTQVNTETSTRNREGGVSASIGGVLPVATGSLTLQAGRTNGRELTATRAFSTSRPSWVWRAAPSTSGGCILQWQLNAWSDGSAYGRPRPDGALLPSGMEANLVHLSNGDATCEWRLHRVPPAGGPPEDATAKRVITSAADASPAIGAITATVTAHVVHPAANLKRRRPRFKGKALACVDCFYPPSASTSPLTVPQIMSLVSRESQPVPLPTSNRRPQSFFSHVLRFVSFGRLG